jgi:hypothetical protein
MTYSTNVGEVELEACYEGHMLKSFSHAQSRIPTASSLERAPAVIAVMREVEKSVEARCSVKGFASGMKSDCTGIKCEE